MQNVRVNMYQWYPITCICTHAITYSVVVSTTKASTVRPEDRQQRASVTSDNFVPTRSKAGTCVCVCMCVYICIFELHVLLLKPFYSLFLPPLFVPSSLRFLTSFPLSFFFSSLPFPIFPFSFPPFFLQLLSRRRRTQVRVTAMHSRTSTGPSPFPPHSFSVKRIPKMVCVCVGVCVCVSWFHSSTCSLPLLALLTRSLTEDPEKRQKLQKFEGARSISSASYFERNEVCMCSALLASLLSHLFFPFFIFFFPTSHFVCFFFLNTHPLLHLICTQRFHLPFVSRMISDQTWMHLMWRGSLQSQLRMILRK